MALRRSKRQPRRRPAVGSGRKGRPPRASRRQRHPRVGLLPEGHAGAGDFLAAAVHRAQSEHRDAWQLDPKMGAARLRLADAYLQVQDVQNAGQEYVKAASLLPTSVDAQVKAATMLLLAHQYDEARACAETALQQDPKSVLA